MNTRPRWATVVYDANDRHGDAAAIQDLADRAGVVVVDAYPRSTAASVIPDLCAALGFNDCGIEPSSVQPRRALRLQAWMRAEPVTDVILHRAHFATAEAWRELGCLTEAGGARLWLTVHRTTPTPDQAALVEEWQTAKVTLRDVLADPPQGRQEPVDPDFTAQAADFPEIPESDMFSFTADCHELLAPRELQRAMVTYEVVR